MFFLRSGYATLLHKYAPHLRSTVRHERVQYADVFVPHTHVSDQESFFEFLFVRFHDYNLNRTIKMSVGG